MGNQVGSPSSSTCTSSRQLRMSQAPPPLAPTGEEAIYQTINVEPEAFADSDQPTSLEQAYEVDLTLNEIEKGGYYRVSNTLKLLSITASRPSQLAFERTRADQIKLIDRTTIRRRTTPRRCTCLQSTQG